MQGAVCELNVHTQGTKDIAGAAKRREENMVGRVSSGDTEQ